MVGSDNEEPAAEFYQLAILSSFTGRNL
jgi:hypothetical protein